MARRTQATLRARQAGRNEGVSEAQPTLSQGPAPSVDPRLHGSLRHAVDEAARLLKADGAIMYLLEPGGELLKWAYDAGISSDDDRAWMRSMVLPVGVGMFGLSVQERSVRITHDYQTDTSFPHAWITDEVVRGTDIHGMVVAPLLAGDEVLGALGVYSTRVAAFDEWDATLLRALADHAAASVANSRLIEQLDRSRAELERRAETERTLREITGRIIAAVGDPTELLQRVVDESMRLLGADGAHLCLMAETETALVPMVVAGSTDESTRVWLQKQRFPIGGGMNGLAAQMRHTVWTRDYLVDPRIPHESDDQSVARRLGLRAMAVAPFRGPEGEVTGTLAISYRKPRVIDESDLSLLGALAAQASIAVTNSRLYDDLRESEARYRYLLQNSPDIAWSLDDEARFTFMSDALEPITGWRTDEALGQHFSFLVHPDSVEAIGAAWVRISNPPYAEEEADFFMRGRDGRPIPANVRAAPLLEDGQFRGAHGRTRDMRQQVRMQDDLRRQAAELAVAQERGHLARELHDSVTQALFSMTLTTRSIELLLDRDPDAARTQLTELRGLERDALAEMRSLIFELRPQNLEANGLMQALRTHAAAVEGRTGLPISVDCDLSERPALPVENALYRIAQEALHNIIRHASASGVRIHVREDRGWVEMQVEDDGHGFDPASIAPGHLGLDSMRTRAEQLGGHLEIRSEPGHGTRIAVTVPRSSGEASRSV